MTVIYNRLVNELLNPIRPTYTPNKGTNQLVLLHYIGTIAASPESNFWRVVSSLCEILPAGSDDIKQATGLLTNKDSLIRESKTSTNKTIEQSKL
jgi:putative DNA methylase